MKSAIALLILAATFGAEAADPQLTSWFTLNSSKPAQIYRTEAEKYAGQTETTWSNGRNTQAQTAFCGVQEISSSSNWVYIRSTGLGSQVMGPWLNGRFPNLPTDQHFIYAISRHCYNTALALQPIYQSQFIRRFNFSVHFIDAQLRCH